MPTTGFRSPSEAVEPKKGARPKLKTPPSDPTSQKPFGDEAGNEGDSAGDRGLMSSMWMNPLKDDGLRPVRTSYAPATV